MLTSWDASSFSRLPLIYSGWKPSKSVSPLGDIQLSPALPGIAVLYGKITCNAKSCNLNQSGTVANMISNCLNCCVTVYQDVNKIIIVLHLLRLNVCIFLAARCKNLEHLGPESDCMVGEGYFGTNFSGFPLHIQIVNQLLLNIFTET